MTVGMDSGLLHPGLRAPTAPSDLARLASRLPVLLSAVAGLVDVIGFLRLGLFTAHITVNLVVIAAVLVRGGPLNLAQVLAVPVFAADVGAVWVIAKALGMRGPALVRPLLLLQYFVRKNAATFTPSAKGA